MTSLVNFPKKTSVNKSATDSSPWKKNTILDSKNMEDILPHSSISQVSRAPIQKLNFCDKKKKNSSFYKCNDIVSLPTLKNVSRVDKKKTIQKTEKIFKEIEEKINNEIKYKTSAYKAIQAVSKRRNNLEYEDYTRKEKWERDLHIEDWMKSRDMLPSSKFTIEQKVNLKLWFDVLDVDGSGEISLEELEDPLLSVGLAETKEDIQKLIDSVDTDGSGEIGFEEFLVVIEEASRINKKNKIKELNSKDTSDHNLSISQKIVENTRNNDRHQSNQKQKNENETSREKQKNKDISYEVSELKNRTEKVRNALFGGDEKINPLVQIHQYHQKSGFSNFNVAIGFCRRKLLFDAVEEFKETNEELLALQENIRKKERMKKLVSIEEIKREEDLSRRCFELKRYMSNMEKIIGQYLEEEKSKRDPKEILTKHDRFEQMMRKRSLKKRQKLDSYGYPIFDLVSFLTEDKAKKALVQEAKLQFLNHGISEDTNEEVGCENLYQDNGLNTNSVNNAEKASDTFIEINTGMDHNETDDNDEGDSPLNNWYEESGLALKRLGEWR